MMSRYMLDTDILSYVIRGTNPKLNRKVASKSGRLCMSSVTYHELLYGARMRGSQRIESVVDVLAEMVPVVDFSDAAADQAAAIRAALDRSGRTIGVMDALIAATAKAERCILVTNNTNHFSRIDGLSIENWAAAPD